MKHGHVVHQSVCGGIAYLFAIMVAMDAKFGITYCAISDIRIFLYFQLQLPQNFTDSNETYSILKS